MFRRVVIGHPMVPSCCNPVTAARQLRPGLPHSAMVAALWFAVGCVSEAASGAGPKAPSPEYREVQVDRLVVTSGESLTAYELFSRGKAELERRDYAAAAHDLDLVATQDPQGPWKEEALYLGARAHEDDGDRLGAAQRFARVAREFPSGEFSRDAYLRAIRLFVFVEQWSDAGQLSHGFVERYAERAPREEIVVQSAMALAEIAGPGQLVERRARALAAVTKARSVIERYQLDGAGNIPRDLAQVYFAKAELLRLEGEALVFDPMPPDFADHFEHRAQLLLDAQSAYSDVMRAYDAHWTAMAGFRVGELYQKLHHDVMNAPRPAGVDTERRRLVFEAALRVRYSVLLKKGLAMMEHTLAMAERTGEASAWVSRAKQARDDLQAAYVAEQAAVDACPYTKADIEQVLADIARRNRRR